jgi:hypothetical protein
MSFQNVSHELIEAPIGRSMRVHLIGTGKSLVRSVSEKNAIPGRPGELQTQP